MTHSLIPAMIMGYQWLIILIILSAFVAVPIICCAILASRRKNDK